MPVINLSAELKSQLTEIVGDAFIDDPTQMAAYTNDVRGHYEARASLVLKPNNTDEVAKIVKLCATNSLSFIPQGGNTGLVAGAIPRAEEAELIISLERMNTIRETDAINFTMTVDAGCILENIQNSADKIDRLFPLSLAAEGSCQIGGNLATNAGGTAVLKYGNARDLVLGLEVVLPNGKVWDGLRALRKDNAGYDLKQLFLGSEGTLGVITGAVLKLFPKPKSVCTALIALPSIEATTLLLNLLRETTGDMLNAFEYMDKHCLELLDMHSDLSNPLSQSFSHYALVELSSSHDSDLNAVLESVLVKAYESSIVLDALIGASLSQMQYFWKMRETIPTVYKKLGFGVIFDISVPVSSVPSFINKANEFIESITPTAFTLIFGHIGDGNIHYCVMQPQDGKVKTFRSLKNDLTAGVNDLAISLNGSFTAEHGVGLAKIDELLRYRSEVEIQLMQQVKSTLDPLNICNPGKVISR